MKGAIFGPNWGNTLKKKLNLFTFWTVLKQILDFFVSYSNQASLCMLWVAYLTAIGYGIDEAVWINVDETPVPYHVGGRHGWKKNIPYKICET